MTINPSGNVGIGTASPSQKLDVKGSFKVDMSTLVPAIGAFSFGDTSEPVLTDISYNGGNDSIFGFSNSGSAAGRTEFSWKGDGVYHPILSLLNNGNVGIGNLPAAGFQLDVLGASYIHAPAGVYSVIAFGTYGIYCNASTSPAIFPN